jgi:hypothetical protein
MPEHKETLKEKIDWKLYDVGLDVSFAIDWILENFDEKKHPWRLMFLQAGLAAITAVITTTVICLKNR